MAIIPFGSVYDDKHVDIFSAVVGPLLTVRFNVTTESQPAALFKLAVYIPDAFIVCPFQV